MTGLQEAFQDLVSGIVTINADVLCAFMKNRVGSYMLSCLIVTEHCDRQKDWNMKVLQQMCEPNSEVVAEDLDTVFCFFFFQETKEDPRNTQKPVKDLADIWQLPQFASQKACN